MAEAAGTGETKQKRRAKNSTQVSQVSTQVQAPEPSSTLSQACQHRAGSETE